MEKIETDLSNEVRQAAHRALEDRETEGFIVLVTGSNPETDSAALVAAEDDLDMAEFIIQSIKDLFEIHKRILKARIRQNRAAD